MIGEGDLVAIRWVSIGTHDGEFMGLEPTERQASFGGMTFLRFAQDRIVEGSTQLVAHAGGGGRSPGRESSGRDARDRRRHRDLESAVTGATWTEGVVLRYGAFYGPGANISLGA